MDEKTFLPFSNEIPLVHPESLLNRQQFNVSLKAYDNQMYLTYYYYYIIKYKVTAPMGLQSYTWFYFNKITSQV